MQQSRRKVVKAAAISSAVLVGLAAGSAIAATSDHTSIVLKDWQGNEIARPAAGAAAAAYSSKQTCFGTNNGLACHGNAAAAGTAKYSYDDIERHNYHTQLGSNEFRGFNPATPDAYNAYDKDPVTGKDNPTAGDKWRTGPGPQGKNWVQSPGHMGSW